MFRVFSDPLAPIWGRYQINIKPAGSTDIVYQKVESVSTPYIPITVVWNGRYWDGYSVPSKRNDWVPDGTYQVEITASDNAGNPATINASGFFIVDNTAPVISSADLPDAYTNGLIPTAAVMVRDNIDSSGQIAVYYQSTTAPQSVNPALTGIPFNGQSVSLSGNNQGTRWVYFQAVDRAGNRSLVLSDSIIFDTTLPDSTITWMSGQPGTDSDREVSGNLTVRVIPNDTNLDGVKITLDGMVRQSSSDVTATFITSDRNGRYGLIVETWDKAGNKLVQNRSVYIDNGSPSLSLSNLPSYLVSSAANFDLSGLSDSSFPVTIGVAVDSQPMQWVRAVNGPGTVAMSQNVASEGTHTISVRAVDRLGNISPTQSFSLIVDRTTPNVSVSPGNSDWSKTAIGPIVITGSDPISGVDSIRMRWDNSDIAGGTLIGSGGTTQIPTDGAHTLYLQVTDRAGNRSDLTQTYRQDLSSPIVSVPTFRPGWTTSPIPDFAIAVSDPVPGSGLQKSFAKWNGSDTQNGGQSIVDGTILRVPSEGQNLLTVQAWDNAGNIGTWSGLYQVDTIKPLGSASKSDPNWSRATIGSIVLSATDTAPGSGVKEARYRWDDTAVSSGTLYSDGTTISLPTEGDHRLYIQVWDNAGNAGPVWQGTYRQDTLAPTVAGNQSATEWRTAPIPAITVTAADNSPGSGIATIRYKWNDADIDGGTILAPGQSIFVPGDGDHTLTLKAWDTAGNASTVWTGRYKQDRIAPVCSADKSGSGWYLTPIGPITLAASDAIPGSGVASAKYRWDNPDVANGTPYSTGTQITIPSEGTHTLYLTVTDTAGQTGTWTGVYQQDTQAPSLGYNGATATWAVSAIGPIRLTVTDAWPGSGTSSATYKWDNSNPVGGTGFKSGDTILIPSEGEHLLYLTAVDPAGNTSTVSAIRYAQDATLPVVGAD
ncbi:hypothetical protein EBR96_03250, partial [bacterium]|nr:hypothetical protein [bacterium]